MAFSWLTGGLFVNIGADTTGWRIPALTELLNGAAAPDVESSEALVLLDLTWIEPSDAFVFQATALEVSVDVDLRVEGVTREASPAPEIALPAIAKDIEGFVFVQSAAPVVIEAAPNEQDAPTDAGQGLTIVTDCSGDLEDDGAQPPPAAEDGEGNENGPNDGTWPADWPIEDWPTGDWSDDGDGLDEPDWDVDPAGYAPGDSVSDLPGFDPDANALLA